MRLCPGMPVSSYWHEVQRQVCDRAPRALLVYFLLETLSLASEVVLYPERVRLALVFWVVCSLIAGGAYSIVRLRPSRSVEALAGAAAVAGSLIAAYHFMAGASSEWCLLVLTGLLCAIAVFFPWGWRPQLIASSGVIVSYPLVIAFGVELGNPLPPALLYLLCVVGFSCYGAEVNQRYLRESFDLTRGIAAREARLRSYLDQALIGIGVISPDGTWREVNAALCHMVGYPSDALLGRPWTDIVHPEESARSTTALAVASSGQRPGATVDVQLCARDGRTVFAAIASRSFHGPDGEPQETVLMILDVTDRRRAQVELEFARDAAEAAYNSKSEFLAHMSHELRTPMNIIFGMTEMAMDESGSNVQLEVLGRTRDAAKSLLVLVDEVLDLSRIETGRMRLNPRRFGLRTWLAAVIDPMSTLATSKGLELSWCVGDGVPDRVFGDTDRMRQIVVNLVANAIKFTDSGSVRVSVDRAAGGGSGGELEFGVEDTGIGIPLRFRSRVFEAFVQAGEERQPGTGLGLTICSRLVELMGGRIWLQSEVGQGSCFRFTVPGSQRLDS